MGILNTPHDTLHNGRGDWFPLRCWYTSLLPEESQAASLLTAIAEAYTFITFHHMFFCLLLIDLGVLRHYCSQFKTPHRWPQFHQLKDLKMTFLQSILLHFYVFEQIFNSASLLSDVLECSSESIPTKELASFSLPDPFSVLHDVSAVVSMSSRLTMAVTASSKNFSATTCIVAIPSKVAGIGYCCCAEFAGSCQKGFDMLMHGLWMNLASVLWKWIAGRLKDQYANKLS